MIERRYILIYGGVVSGLSFIGPFNEHAEAERYAELYHLTGWEIAELDSPETTEDE